VYFEAIATSSKTVYFKHALSFYLCLLLTYLLSEYSDFEPEVVLSNDVAKSRITPSSSNSAQLHLTLVDDLCTFWLLYAVEGRTLCEQFTYKIIRCTITYHEIIFRFLTTSVIMRDAIAKIKQNAI